MRASFQEGPGIPQDTVQKFHRVLQLLTLIQGRNDWNAQRLARELGVAERTIYRYLDDFEQAGIPYFFDEQTGGYRVRADFFLPPIQLTIDEALSLSVLCEEAAGRERIPHLRPAWRAMGKIESLLPAPVRAELAGLSGHVSVQLAQTNPADGTRDVYELVRGAIASRRSLRCVYEPARPGAEPAEEMLFDPYALFFSVRAWYAIGKRSDRDSLRCLKLGRFSSIVATDTPYTVPSDFAVESFIGNAWRMMRSDIEHDVEIWFDPSFTQTVSDTQWHPTQQFEFHEDGSCTFRCRVAGLDEIVWWALSMGPHCIVKQPLELRERLSDLAQRTARQYSDQPRP